MNLIWQGSVIAVVDSYRQLVGCLISPQNNSSILLLATKLIAGIEAREVKYCIQGDGLAMADEKMQRIS